MEEPLLLDNHPVLDAIMAASTQEFIFHRAIPFERRLAAS